ncbi:class I SAM-dependent methyltransferase [Limnobacter sp.]|uniref:class I SAM-dependent methyltransferase n=1 Tax=Limnobacter sp. TaxID=2003368 RepID=UPI004037D185
MLAHAKLCAFKSLTLQLRHYVAADVWRTELDSSSWNQKYAAEELLYGETPNEFLADMITVLPSDSKIFVPGDGEGRNGVWLAQKGFQVTTVDSSETGVAKAKALASRKGVSLDQQLGDLTNWSYPQAEFDGAVLIYLHLPASIRAQVHQNIAKAIKPGGVLILECFHPDQLSRTSGGPKNIEMLYTSELLRSDFAGLLVPHFEFEGEVQLQEGTGHSGVGVVTRLVARRMA